MGIDRAAAPTMPSNGWPRRLRSHCQSSSQKNRWTLTTDSAGEVTIRYRLYCRVLAVQSNWVDAEFAMLNGAPTFLTLLDDLEQKKLRPQIVRLELPSGWERSVTGLEPSGEGEHEYKAASFDILVDSPMLVDHRTKELLLLPDRRSDPTGTHEIDPDP